MNKLKSLSKVLAKVWYNIKIKFRKEINGNRKS